MSRNRVAIAHFSDHDAELRTRKAVLALGGEATPLLTEQKIRQTRSICQLKVALPANLERQLLEVLLVSEATRVDVHDAEA